MQMKVKSGASTHFEEIASWHVFYTHKERVSQQ